MFEDTTELVDALEEAHARVSSAQRDLFEIIARMDRHEGCRDEGARDLARFLSMRYGISAWKAHRWVTAAHALEELPRLAEAFASGRIGIDKVVELCRFATPETEGRLIRWANEVSVGAVRHRGDLAARATRDELVDVERTRTLSWWYFDEGRRFGLEAELPAAQGAIVARALERAAEQVPVMPDLALAQSQLASDPDPDRATVVVHARLDGLEDGTGGCELDDGPVIDPETVRRLLCNARTQTILEGEGGDVLGVGRMSRQPSAWMIRQVRYRDRGCRFPGCGTRSFTEAHHLVWWCSGGHTDLDNLALICSFHHRLVHEYGWTADKGTDGTLTWSRPDGTRYRAGPSPGPIRKRLVA